MCFWRRNIYWKNDTEIFPPCILWATSRCGEGVCLCVSIPFTVPVIDHTKDFSTTRSTGHHGEHDDSMSLSPVGVAGQPLKIRAERGLLFISLWLTQQPAFQGRYKQGAVPILSLLCLSLEITQPGALMHLFWQAVQTLCRFCSFVNIYLTNERSCWSSMCVWQQSGRVCCMTSIPLWHPQAPPDNSTTAVTLQWRL